MSKVPGKILSCELGSFIKLSYSLFHTEHSGELLFSQCLVQLEPVISDDKLVLGPAGLSLCSR